MNNYGNSVIYKIDMRYLNAKIYKLVSNVTGDVYYGSTITNLKERLRCHKKDYKRYLKGKGDYYTSFKIIETGDYKVELVEKYSCLCKKQLEAIERVYIEGYVCVNKCLPTRNHKESYKTYYEKNKDEINKKRREKRKRIYKCECGSQYHIQQRARHFRTKKHQVYLNQ